jgi:hypothetical protein
MADFNFENLVPQLLKTGYSVSDFERLRRVGHIRQLLTVLKMTEADLYRHVIPISRTSWEGVKNGTFATGERQEYWLSAAEQALSQKVAALETEIKKSTPGATGIDQGTEI